PASNEEAAGGIAVPRDPQLGAPREDRIDDQLAVLRQERIRLVSRELAVGLEVEAVLLDRKAVDDRPDHRTRHAVAAVEHDLHGADRLWIDEAEHMLLEGAVKVLARNLAPGGGASEVAGLGFALDVRDAGVPRKRERSAAQQLEPGPGLGIVGRGHGHAAVQVS